MINGLFKYEPKNAHVNPLLQFEEIAVRLSTVFREGAAFLVLLRDNNCIISQLLPHLLDRALNIALVRLGEEEQAFADQNFDQHGLFDRQPDLNAEVWPLVAH